VGKLLIGCIRLYQRFLSPLLGQNCRFHPSCSQYAIGAIEVHGAGKGLLLTAWRILRCQPFCSGGHDPVPPKGAWRSDPPRGHGC
jgi:putative membrane protein insertion efficiency factor